MTTRTTLAFLNLAHFLDHFFLLVFPTAVLALHKAWDMTYGEALALGTPVYVAFAAGTLPAGWLADRWSREGMLATFFIGIGASSIATGLAAGPLTLMIGLGAIGLFAAIYHPAGLAMVTEATETPGRALAMNGVWGNMGIASAALATGLVAQALGWRHAFILPGAGSVAVGLAYLMQLKGPATARMDTAGRSTLQAQTAKGDRRRVLIVIGIGALFGGLIFQGVTVALPKLFEERLTTLAGDLTQVGAAASLVFALAAFAQLPVGRLLDRVGARPIYIAAVGLQASFLALLAGAQGLQAFPLFRAAADRHVRRPAGHRLAHGALRAEQMARPRLCGGVRVLARRRRALPCRSSPISTGRAASGRYSSCWRAERPSSSPPPGCCPGTSGRSPSRRLRNSEARVV